MPIHNESYSSKTNNNNLISETKYTRYLYDYDNVVK